MVGITTLNILLMLLTCLQINLIIIRQMKRTCALTVLEMQLQTMNEKIWNSGKDKALSGCFSSSMKRLSYLFSVLFSQKAWFVILLNVF